MVLPEGCNTEWVVSQLDKFIRITDGKFVSGPGGEFDPMWDSDFDRDEILDEVVIVEETFDAFCPGWKCEEGDCSLADHDENPWKEYRDLALRVRSFARCSDSIQQNLGNSALLFAQMTCIRGFGKLLRLSGVLGTTVRRLKLHARG